MVANDLCDQLLSTLIRLCTNDDQLTFEQASDELKNILEVVTVDDLIELLPPQDIIPITIPKTLTQFLNPSRQNEPCILLSLISLILSPLIVSIHEDHATKAVMLLQLCLDPKFVQKNISLVISELYLAGCFQHVHMRLKLLLNKPAFRDSSLLAQTRRLVIPLSIYTQVCSLHLTLIDANEDACASSEQEEPSSSENVPDDDTGSYLCPNCNLVGSLISASGSTVMRDILIQLIDLNSVIFRSIREYDPIISPVLLSLVYVTSVSAEQSQERLVGQDHVSEVKPTTRTPSISKPSGQNILGLLLETMGRSDRGLYKRLTWGIRYLLDRTNGPNIQRPLSICYVLSNLTVCVYVDMMCSKICGLDEWPKFLFELASKTAISGSAVEKKPMESTPKSSVSEPRKTSTALSDQSWWRFAMSGFGFGTSGSFNTQPQPVAATASTCHIYRQAKTQSLHRPFSPNPSARIEAKSKRGTVGSCDEMWTFELLWRLIIEDRLLLQMVELHSRSAQLRLYNYLGSKINPHRALLDFIQKWRNICVQLQAQEKFGSKAKVEMRRSLEHDIIDAQLKALCSFKDIFTSIPFLQCYLLATTIPAVTRGLVDKIAKERDLINLFRLIRSCHTLISFAQGFNGLPQDLDVLFKRMMKLTIGGRALPGSQQQLYGSSSANGCSVDIRNFRPTDIYGLLICRTMYDNGILGALKKVTADLKAFVVMIGPAWSNDRHGQQADKEVSKEYWCPGLYNLLNMIQSRFLDSASASSQNGIPYKLRIVYPDLTSWLLMQPPGTAEVSIQSYVKPGWAIRHILLSEVEQLANIIKIGTLLSASLVELNNDANKILTYTLDESGVATAANVQQTYPINTLGFYVNSVSHAWKDSPRLGGHDSSSTLTDSKPNSTNSTQPAAAQEDYRTTNSSADAPSPLTPSPPANVWLLPSAKSNSTHVRDKTIAASFSNRNENIPNCCSESCMKYSLAKYLDEMCRLSRHEQIDFSCFVSESSVNPSLCAHLRQVQEVAKSSHALRERCSETSELFILTLRQILFGETALVHMMLEVLCFISDIMCIVLRDDYYTASCILQNYIALLVFRIALRLESELLDHCERNFLISKKDISDESAVNRSATQQNRRVCSEIIMRMQEFIDKYLIPDSNSPLKVGRACLYLTPLLHAPSRLSAQHEGQIKSILNGLLSLSTSRAQPTRLTAVIPCLKPSCNSSHLAIIKQIFIANGDLHTAAFAAACVTAKFYNSSRTKRGRSTDFIEEWTLLTLNLFRTAQDQLAQTGSDLGGRFASPALMNPPPNCLGSVKMPEDNSESSMSQNHLCVWLCNWASTVLVELLATDCLCQMTRAAFLQIFDQTPTPLRVAFLLDSRFWDTPQASELATEVLSTHSPFSACGLDASLPAGSPALLLWNASYWQANLLLIYMARKARRFRGRCVIYFGERSDWSYEKCEENQQFKSVSKWCRRSHGEARCRAITPFMLRGPFLLIRRVKRWPQSESCSEILSTRQHVIVCRPPLLTEDNCDLYTNNENQGASSLQAFLLRWYTRESQQSGSERPTNSYGMSDLIFGDSVGYHPKSEYEWLCCDAFLSAPYYQLDQNDAAAGDELQIAIGIRDHGSQYPPMFIDNTGECQMEPTWCVIDLQRMLWYHENIAPERNSTTDDSPYVFNMKVIDGHLCMVGISFMMKHYHVADEGCRMWARNETGTSFDQIWNDIDSDRVLARTQAAEGMDSVIRGGELGVSHLRKIDYSLINPASNILRRIASIPNGLRYIQDSLLPFRTQKHWIDSQQCVTHLIAVAVDLGGIWEPDCMALRILGDVYGPNIPIPFGPAISLLMRYLGKAPSFLHQLNTGCHKFLTPALYDTSHYSDRTDHWSSQTKLHIDLYQRLTTISIINLHRLYFPSTKPRGRVAKGQSQSFSSARSVQWKKSSNIWGDSFVIRDSQGTTRSAGELGREESSPDQYKDLPSWAELSEKIEGELTTAQSPELDIAQSEDEDGSPPLCIHGRRLAQTWDVLTSLEHTTALAYDRRHIALIEQVREGR